MPVESTLATSHSSQFNVHKQPIHQLSQIIYGKLGYGWPFLMRSFLCKVEDLLLWPKSYKTPRFIAYGEYNYHVVALKCLSSSRFQVN